MLGAYTASTAIDPSSSSGINSLPSLGQSHTQNANSAVTGDNVLLGTVHVGTGTPNNFYAANNPVQPLNVGSITPTGGNQPHANIQPYLALNWCICQYGIFPSRN